MRTRTRTLVPKRKALRLGAKAAVLLAAFMTAGFSAQAAAAQTTLTGEGFIATGPGAIVFTDQNCTPTGGSFNFSVEGTATGPVPGFFTEAGTVVLGPEVASVRSVLSFEAVFTVREVVGGIPGEVIVEGFKRLLDPSRLFSAAGCQSNTSDISSVRTEGLCYTAQFIGTGVTESGRSHLGLLTDDTEFGDIFVEEFASDPTVSCPRPGDDDDDDDDDSEDDSDDDD